MRIASQSAGHGSQKEVVPAMTKQGGPGGWLESGDVDGHRKLRMRDLR